jgi:putative Mg2+ transporter-C (MgtC) family protein
MFPIPGGDWAFLDLMHFFLPRVLFAVICGGIIGFERELKNKPAGLKTNILICLGSALYTAVSVLTSATYAGDGYHGDPSRIAAQIVSGIGFLGGGTIIQARGTILGLTTAATIWVVAAIGICVGIGHYDIAFASAVTVLLVLIGTNLFEDRVLGRSLTFAVEIVAQDPQGEVRLSINQALAQNNLILDDFDISSRGADSVMSCRYNGHRGDHKKFVLDLWSTPGIREVRQL